MANHSENATPASMVGEGMPLFGKSKEILRLRSELNGALADNQVLMSRLNAAAQQHNADLAEMQRLGVFTEAQRRQQLAALEQQIQTKTVELQQRLQQAQAQYDEQMRLRKAALEQQLEALNHELTAGKEEQQQLTASLLDLRAANSLQEVGLYDFDNPTEDSTKLAAQLEDTKQKMKTLVKDNAAVKASTRFVYNNSPSQGEKFVRDMSKMALSLFNAEAEACVKNVKAGNLDTSIARLDKCRDRVAKFGKIIDLIIAPAYYKLRVKELSLTSQYMQAVQAAKEAEREQRAELREQQKAQKELEAEMERLNKEHDHYENVIEKMRENGDVDKVAELEAKLDDINKSINDVDYRAANIRAGYVYVISDIGAFGERMVKIGMTRRLDPMDRVRELSDASVPFKFDVHALFFSKDAVSLETMLHHEFEHRRVNRMNARKEFYYCTPQEVLDKLREKDIALVEFKVEADAEEYRMSQQIAKGAQGE